MHKWHCITSHRITSDHITYIHTYTQTYEHTDIQTYSALRYLTSRHITLHYSTLQCIALYCTTLLLHYIKYIHTYIYIIYIYMYVSVCVSLRNITHLCSSRLRSLEGLAVQITVCMSWLIHVTAVLQTKWFYTRDSGLMSYLWVNYWIPLRLVRVSSLGGISAV